MSPSETLKSLGIVVTPPAPPVAAYTPFVRSGNLVLVSGHLSKRSGEIWAGKLGKDLVTSEGAAAARSVAIDLLGTLQLALGDLDRVGRILRLMVLVNSAEAFTEQHLVANGASELFAQVFGPAGVHARAAFGVAQIPLGACVEIDLIAECKDTPSQS